jgi:serine/threonine protein kinase
MPQIYGDRWKLERPLVEGGQSHTYLVYNVNDADKKLYVLKRLKNLARLSRFKKEIEACLSLDHNYILKIVDENLESEQPYFVTEYCAYGALTTDKISELSVVQKLGLFAAICSGVGHAHSKGIIHRDLKPHNIFLRDKLTPVVGDFGLCFVDEEGERVTMTEEQIGSRFYMAPELASGRSDEITPAADVYALGKVLYWILAGRVFDREAHRSPRFDLTVNQTSPEIFFIYDVLDKTIAEEPSGRFTDANALYQAVDTTLKLIGKRAHVLDLHVPQECNYCGMGQYKVVANSTSRDERSGSTNVHNFGFTLVGSPQWLIMVCDYCGNVQIFRPDYAKRDSSWYVPRSH